MVHLQHLLQLATWENYPAGKTTLRMLNLFEFIRAYGTGQQSSGGSRGKAAGDTEYFHSVGFRLCTWLNYRRRTVTLVCSNVEGWGFQLNMDATFVYCLNAVDMIAMGVNVIPHQKNIMCFCIIPAKTKGENFYTRYRRQS